MSSSSALKEFLVKITFKNDQQSYRNFQEAMERIAKGAVEITKNFVKLGEASAVAGTAMGLVLAQTAKALEGVYFQAKRTGASAKELDILSYAAERVGVSAETARGAVESLAAARRTNPGLNGILAGMGIDPRQIDNAKVMVQLLDKLGSMPHYQAAQIAGMFGINEQMLKQIEDHRPQFQGALKDREVQIKTEGYDPDKQDKAANDFMNQWAHTTQGLKDFKNTIETDLMPAGTWFLHWIDEAVIKLFAADQATNGWSTRIIGLTGAISGVIGAKAGIGLLGKVLGRGGAVGGAAVVGEGTAAVAGEGAAAGGASMLGLGEGAAAAGGLAAAGSIALPVVIASAIVAAIAWCATHPEQLKKAWEWTKVQAKQINDLGDKAKAAIGGWAQNLNKEAHAAGGWGKSLSIMPGMIGELARMTAGFEGFRDKVYKDIGGKLTFGFGHLVKPGEDTGKENPMALFASDLKDALASVHKLVKVKLTDNQQKALADFVFNLGEANLAKSTLLKKLNSGDFAGAADRFKDFDQVHHKHFASLAARRAAEAQLFRTPDKSVTINQKNEYNVSSTDPKGAGNEIELRQKRANGDLVRNFAGAVQ